MYTKDEVESLLQGNWQSNSSLDKLIIDGNEIARISDDGSTDKGTFLLLWSSRLYSWEMVVTQFGWDNFVIMTLDERVFHLYEATVHTINNLDIQYQKCLAD